MFCVSCSFARSPAYIGAESTAQRIHKFGKTFKAQYNSRHNSKRLAKQQPYNPMQHSDFYGSEAPIEVAERIESGVRVLHGNCSEWKCKWFFGRNQMKIGVHFAHTGERDPIHRRTMMVVSFHFRCVYVSVLCCCCCSLLFVYMCFILFSFSFFAIHRWATLLWNAKCGCAVSFESFHIRDRIAHTSPETCAKPKLFRALVNNFPFEPFRSPLSRTNQRTN